MQAIDRIDRNWAYRDHHPGEIYLHMGQHYGVVSFDEDRHHLKCVVKPTSVDANEIQSAE